MNRLSSFSFVLFLVFSTATCQSSDGDGVTDTNTNWLMTCESDADCGGDLCLCGRCTARCQRDADCSSYGEEAVCGVAAASCAESYVCERAAADDFSAEGESSFDSAPSSGDDVSAGTVPSEAETIPSMGPSAEPSIAANPTAPSSSAAATSSGEVETAVGGSAGSSAGAAGAGATSNGGAVSGSAGDTNFGGATSSGGSTGASGGSSSGGASAGAGGAGMCVAAGQACVMPGGLGSGEPCCAHLFCQQGPDGSCTDSEPPTCQGTCSCHAEGEACFSRSGAAGEVTLPDEPCCNGQSCTNCATSDGVEVCRCENAARDCAAACDVLEPYPMGWCDPAQGFATATHPIEWVCNGAAPLEQLESECISLATGAARWCCPETFDAVCE